MDDATHQVDAMERLATLQSRTDGSLLRLTGPQVPPEAFERYVCHARELLNGVIAIEARWPGTFEARDYAQPLVQQLSRYADNEEAAGHRERAARLRTEVDRLTAQHLATTDAAAVLRERAMGHAMAGQFHDALVGLNEARRAYETAGDHVQTAQTLVQEANVLEWLCDYERSLATLDAARTLVAADLADGPPTLSKIALGLGKEFLGILWGKDYSSGMDALALSRIHFEIVQGQARINIRLGNHDVARRLLEEARPYVQLLVRPGVDYHIAAIAVAKGEFAEADRLLGAMESAFRRGLLRSRRGALRQLQADVLLARSRPEDALARVEEGLADQADYPDLDLGWKLQWRRAKALVALGRTKEALDAYKGAAVIADTLRRAPLGYVLDTTLLRDKMAMFDEALNEAVAQGDVLSAVHFVELVKARALSAVLSNPRRAQDHDEGLEGRFDEVSTRLDAISFRFQSGLAVAQDVDERGNLLKVRADLLEEIRIRDPRWRAMTEAAEVDVPALQAQIGPDRRVLVLHRRGRRILSAVLGPEQGIMGELECTEAVEAALVEYADNLRRASPDWFLSDLSGELGVMLTDLVPDDVARAAVEASTLLVVPHGLLHLLPWASLKLGDQRVFQHTAVGVLPNLSALTLLDGDLGPPTSVALLGDPDYTGLHTYRDLPHAGAEISDVASLYGDGLVVPPVTRADATDSALIELMRRPDVERAILHVVSHGDLDADEPLSAGLVLTKSKLDAAEIMRLHCAYPEVVLSACSTGWRPQASRGLDLAGDEALGLTASFLEAGVRSLLVSIPQAKDDVTRSFMVEWHRRRRAGATPLQACRQVQLHLFRDDPETLWAWAGITAYGCR